MPITIPEQLIAYPYWTKHNNKRPIVKIGDFSNARSFSEVEDALHDMDNGVGILLSRDQSVAVIDIDFNGSKIEKAKLQNLAKDVGFENPQDWALETYKDFLAQNSKLFSQIAGTELESLIANTYTELSPTGTGLHAFIKLTDKARTKTAYKKSTNEKYAGQISLQNCFITVTGIPLHGSSSNLVELSLTDFPNTFSFSAKQLSGMEDIENQKDNENLEKIELPLSLPVPTKDQVITALNLVPPQPLMRTQKLWYQFTNKSYEHYDFWITIGMALHDWGSKTQQLPTAYMLWSDWSRRDEANYKGEDDLEQHWRSFQSSENSITIATLVAIAAKLQFSYPRPMIGKDGRMPAYPLINEYANFEYLMKYYNITLWEDDMYYVSGDEEIMQKYFSPPNTYPLLNQFYGPYNQKELAAFTLRLCQDSNWRKLNATHQLVQTWCNVATINLDVFQEWLNTPQEKLPAHMLKVRTIHQEYDVRKFDHNSTVEYLFSCLNTKHTSEQDKQLYLSCFKKTLMLMIKFREPHFQTSQFADNGGMLILVGPENTYKSTFLRLLLPESLQNARKEVNMQISGEKATRDFLRQLGRKSIIQIDEFEGFMNMAAKSSQFKNLLSGNEVTFTDIYETAERRAVRKAIIVGTTNETRLSLSDNGTRRLWFIPVGKIDTVGAAKVNLHKLYNDLREEFRNEYAAGKLPWLLTQDEIDLLDIKNRGYTASSEMAIILEEFWPTDGSSMEPEYLDEVDMRRYKGPKIMTTLEVAQYIRFKGVNFKGSLASLERALERHCGQWTETLKKEIYRRTAVIIKGRLCQNQKPNGTYTYRKWIMPPISYFHEDKD